ncbi:hypothetical protein IFM89_034876 [Coptis chinensis]|uniref:Uncharacterized protein n=1 Tax=Coptis chinensis TaxID=261450 RepID=A0A835LXA6_9MAGN|nr:hypothetical protein IFM89_034876 [Coptis chinensis]
MSITGCCTYIKGLQLEKHNLHVCVDNRARKTNKIVCSTSGENRGFGPGSIKKEKSKKVKIRKEGTSLEPQKGQPTSKSTETRPSQAPGLISQSDGNFSSIGSNNQFEEKLQAVRRAALEQRKIKESNQFGTIDYDAPIVSEQNAVGLGTKVGVGVAVVVFGLVFAFGDFLPSTSSTDDATVVENKLTQRGQSRLQQYEKELSLSPEDPAALEAAAVTLSELGEYGQAASLLEKLSKEKPSDPDVYRLLGEVKYELKDYEGSAAAYRSSASVSESINFEVLRGLTNVLLAANKPDQAVQVLLASRERLKAQDAATGKSEVNMQDVDPIQVELLLGKAYSDWGHVSDAVSVYDQLISIHPNDFRGYLAKGIILKQNGKVGEAERMFIQARFFAPDKAKSFVDRYSKQ